MTPKDHIRLNELLLKRQELFARIYEAEKQISEISQGHFKIPPVPVELSSSQKRPAKKKLAKAAKEKIPSLPHKKAFYLIFSGDTRHEIYESRAAITARLKLQSIPITARATAEFQDGQIAIINHF